MQIDTGLFDHMVLQRNARGVCEATLSGIVGVDGVVEARVTCGRREIFDWRKIGAARRGKFAATLRGLVTGGPYEVALRVRQPMAKAPSSAPRIVRDVLVGDVWVLAGQSNMKGCGAQHRAAKAHGQVRAFFMDDRWAVARDPIHNLWDAVDSVHPALAGGQRPPPDTTGGVGPGVAFGLEMQRLSGGVPQGLLACAHGGTSMAQWSPALRGKGGASLYGATLRRVRKNGGRVAGIAWYQGESDTYPEAARIYTEAMKKLVAAMRRDFGGADLPFVAVQIARVLVPWGGPAEPWNSIQEQQRLLPTAIRRCAVVPTIDLALGDIIHLGADDANRLGRRLAAAMHTLTTGRGHPSIGLKGWSVTANPDNPATVDIDVEFEHVAGELSAPGGRAQGFEVTDDLGGSSVYRVDLAGARAVVRTTLPASELGTRWLHYGRGMNPFCNVTDAADRSLPVFGPQSLVQPRALTTFARAYDLSEFQPGAGRLEDLAYPDNAEALNFRRRVFAQTFASLRPEIERQGAGVDQLIFYRLTLSCATSMRLHALFGYDGPVKLWLDRTEIYHDPAGSNPALADARQIPFWVEAGEHEFLVGFGTNDGRAWGIFLRFERMGVPRRLVRLGPAACGLPTLPVAA